MKKKKIIYDLTEDVMGVYAISVVEMPAIEANFIALSGKQEVRLKVDNERRMLYGPVLIPDKEILRIDKNTGEEYTIEFPAATIKKACHAFLKQGNQGEHTYEHQFKVQGMTVVESWIKEGDNDKSVHFGMDYPVGTWFVGTKVENDEVWNQVKQGNIKGFSIEGEFMPSEDSELLSKLQNLLEKVNNRWAKIEAVKLEKSALTKKAANKKEFSDLLKNADAAKLIEFGFRVWEETNVMNDEDGTMLPPDHILMLVPGEYYSMIEEGFDFIDIFGRPEKFKKGQSDDDVRFGLLSYGILRKKSEWK